MMITRHVEGEKGARVCRAVAMVTGTNAGCMVQLSRVTVPTTRVSTWWVDLVPTARCKRGQHRSQLGKDRNQPAVLNHQRTPPRKLRRMGGVTETSMVKQTKIVCLTRHPWPRCSEESYRCGHVDACRLSPNSSRVVVG